MIYKIYTDGSSNQGSVNKEIKKGGWAFLITSEDNKIIFEKSEEEFEKYTNNQCEMLAIIYALEKIIELDLNGEIEVYSDSSYVVNAFNEDWIGTWEKTGWLNSYGEPVANKDLWDVLIKNVRQKKVHLKKIKRNSNVFSKHVDKLSRIKMRS